MRTRDSLIFMFFMFGINFELEKEKKISQVEPNLKLFFCLQTHMYFWISFLSDIFFSSLSEQMYVFFCNFYISQASSLQALTTPGLVDLTVHWYCMQNKLLMHHRNIWSTFFCRLETNVGSYTLFDTFTLLLSSVPSKCSKDSLSSMIVIPMSPFWRQISRELLRA